MVFKLILVKLIGDKTTPNIIKVMLMVYSKKSSRGDATSSISNVEVNILCRHTLNVTVKRSI